MLPRSQPCSHCTSEADTCSGEWCNLQDLDGAELCGGKWEVIPLSRIGDGTGMARLLLTIICHISPLAQRPP